MHPKMKLHIDTALSGYRRTGAKSWRKEQYKRVLYIVNDICKHSSRIHQLIDIGRKQLDEFWVRHMHLSDRTRLEYWRAINQLFLSIGKNSPERPPQSTRDEDYQL